MKTKILYVLVSSEDDYYLEQLFVSMTSAKIKTKDCHITILTDKCTMDSLKGLRKNKLDLADEIVTINLDDQLSGQYRSRLLKTNARNYVEGDFLFIDCDTIINKDLSPIDDINYEMAACLDTHSKLSDNPYRELCIKQLNILGQDISKEEFYYNSGVILVRDTDNTHNFYTNWHRNYVTGRELGVTMDQPSFELTNLESNYFVKTLIDTWNCELKHGIRYLKDAYIVHYLTTNKSSENEIQFFLMNEDRTFKDLKEKSVVDKEITDIIEDPFVGIAPVCHCFAGKDLKLFQSTSFKFLSYFNSRYGNLKIFDLIFKIIYKTIILFK